MLMKKKLLILTIISLSMLKCFSQQYIYISEEGIRKFVRADIGYTRWSINAADSNTRSVQGIHLLNEVKIFSGLSENWDGFAIHDAFYVNIDLGVLMEERNSKFIRGALEYESKFSSNLAFGYLGMLGWRTNKWGALIGTDLRAMGANAGGLKIPNIDGPLLYFSSPLMIRTEFCMSKKHPDFRVVLTAWKTLKRKKLHPFEGLRFEFPLSTKGRFWLLAQYAGISGLSEDVFLFDGVKQAKFQQFILGIRVGNLP